MAERNTCKKSNEIKRKSKNNKKALSTMFSLNNLHKPQFPQTEG